jgi:hypothetical protein
MSPGEQLPDELLGDDVAVEESSEDALAEQAHEERGVPSGQEELAQHPLDHRAQGAVLPPEALGPDPQQLLEVLLREPEER